MDFVEFALIFTVFTSRINCNCSFSFVLFVEGDTRAQAALEECCIIELKPDVCLHDFCG